MLFLQNSFLFVFLLKFLGNYAQRHHDQELHKEAEKNQREIHRLRQRLAQLQLNSEQLTLGADPNDQSEEISIVRLT